MKKLQSGRSMIEMLGVLAIIGVLSIGGLAAYNTAMNRHRTNQILDYAGKCLVVAQTELNGGDLPEGGVACDADLAYDDAINAQIEAIGADAAVRVIGADPTACADAAEQARGFDIECGDAG